MVDTLLCNEGNHRSQLPAVLGQNVLGPRGDPDMNLVRVCITSSDSFCMHSEALYPS